MNRSQRIAQQLGMSHGAANNRLKKDLLFNYVCIAGHNVCHVCGGGIESSDDFSIEHIIPWENREPELFWSLENISFSHLKCNKPHQRRGNPDARMCTQGSWCCKCRSCLSDDMFYKDPARWNGLQAYCKECLGEIRKNYPSRNGKSRLLASPSGRASL